MNNSTKETTALKEMTAIIYAATARHTRSKAPQARDCNDIDKRWKRAKAAQVTTKTTWTYRNTNDPQALAQEEKNEEKTKTRAQTTEAKAERKFINSVGDRWKADFRRIALAKGATEADLKRTEEAHLQSGAQEKVMEAIKAIMGGDEDECQKLAEDIAEDASMWTQKYSEQWLNTKLTAHGNMRMSVRPK
jgi:hypothetical protein